MAKKKLIAEAVIGDGGNPGSQFRYSEAEVYALPSGRYELQTRDKRGSNQGYEEVHFCTERTYRADNLSELLAVGIAESRSDDEMSRDDVYQAIRSAIFAAEDSEAEGAEA